MRVGTVISLVIVAVVLVVGVIIIGNLQATVDELDLGTQGNATRTTIFDTTYSAFNISVIGLIVMGAVGIIGVVVGSLTSSRPGGF